MPRTVPEPERQLQRRLGHNFLRPELLRQALTHSSWQREQVVRPGAGPAEIGDDNERLEFLGDAILGLRAAERLYAAFPASREGPLTDMRARLVSASHLAEVAQRLELGPHLLLGRSEAASGRNKPRLLANAMEAVIAAIYLDDGYAAAAAFVDRHVVGDSLDEAAFAGGNEFGHKSALQQWAHAHAARLPVYRVVEETGPEHAKLFTVEVSLAGVYAGQASAPSKKQAEQRAAAAALAFVQAGSGDAAID